MMTFAPLSPTCRVAVCECGARWVADAREDRPECARHPDHAVQTTRVIPRAQALPMFSLPNPLEA